MNPNVKRPPPLSHSIARLLASPGRPLASPVRTLSLLASQLYAKRRQPSQAHCHTLLLDIHRLAVHHRKSLSQEIPKSRLLLSELLAAALLLARRKPSQAIHCSHAMLKHIPALRSAPMSKMSSSVSQRARLGIPRLSLSRRHFPPRRWDTRAHTRHRQPHASLK